MRSPEKNKRKRDTNLVYHWTMFHKTVPGTSNFSPKNGKLVSPMWWQPYLLQEKVMKISGVYVRVQVSREVEKNNASPELVQGYALSQPTSRTPSESTWCPEGKRVQGNACFEYYARLLKEIIYEKSILKKLSIAPGVLTNIVVCERRSALWMVRSL